RSWRIEGEASLVIQVEHLCLDTFGRPSVILPPHVGSGFEDIGFGKLRVTVALQIGLEERELNLLAKVLAGVRREIHKSQAPAFVARPSAMHPRALDQRVEDSGIVLIDGVKGAQWSGEVFGVEPSPNGQYSTVNIL